MKKCQVCDQWKSDKKDDVMGLIPWKKGKCGPQGRITHLFIYIYIIVNECIIESRNLNKRNPTLREDPWLKLSGNEFV